MAAIQMGRTLRLRDGRFLGYAEHGNPTGKPLFWFHGFPGSRLEPQFLHETAAKRDVRVIALDRPGMGLPTFKRARTFLDWPDDVAQAADLLGIDRFAVAGLSGGSPYAAVCALKLADRLTAAGIISGIATLGMSRQNRLLFTLGRRLPWLARLPMAALAFQARNPDRLLRQVERSFAEVDRPIMARPAGRQGYTDGFPQ